MAEWLCYISCGALTAISTCRALADPQADQSGKNAEAASGRAVSAVWVYL